MKKLGLFGLALLLSTGSFLGCSSSKKTFDGCLDEKNLKEIYQRWVAEDYATQSKLLEEYVDLKKCGASPQKFQEAREKTLMYYNNIQLWQSRIKEMNK